VTPDILARKRIWKDRDPEREQRALARARRIKESRPWPSTEPMVLGAFPADVQAPLRALMNEPDNA
jgi:hypothetical protein